MWRAIRLANSVRGTSQRVLSRAQISRILISSSVPSARHYGFNGSIRQYSDGPTSQNKEAQIKIDDPQMMIAFTCTVCDTRSSHVFSKQAYQTGSVLIQCPGCKNRHLIADNLKIFKDNKFSLEEVLKAKGESITTDTQDLEFKDIPDQLKNVIGHHAKDAPEEMTKDSDPESPKYLSDGKSTKDEGK
ncbi:Piso0_002320 [Millerozyma farinosa CBS 7064]|uniref:Piso0_002320 protein n=1 Tax=Pichia sorbitophila (strain ATCC MYA-4447 / BCRC 22081 / CBS 7064 / NBRC 10061 / NRRL Y-12695) TaxID=559304 RepID=G8YEQ8_PICSO|nr:Piso0_002320 [Millerozyma farinosa CBS 7064]